MYKQGLFFRGFLAVLFSQFILQQTVFPQPGGEDLLPSALVNGAQALLPELIQAGREAGRFIPQAALITTAILAAEKGIELVNGLKEYKADPINPCPNVAVNDGSASLTIPLEHPQLANEDEIVIVGDHIIGTGTTTITTNDVGIVKTNIPSAQVTASNQGANTAPIDEVVTYGADQTQVVNQQTVQGSITTEKLKLCPNLTTSQGFTLGQSPD